MSRLMTREIFLGALATGTGRTGRPSYIGASRLTSARMAK